MMDEDQSQYIRIIQSIKHAVKRNPGARLHWLESTSHVSCRPKKLFVLIEVRLPWCIKLLFVFLGLPWEQSFLLQNTFVTLRFNNYLILLHCLKCASHDQTPCRSKT